jgi:hypothetical protein
VFDVQQDEDFITHETVPAEQVVRFKDGENGPNPGDLHFDMRHGPETPWNTEVIEILLTKLKEMDVEEIWGLPPPSSEVQTGPTVMERCTTQVNGNECPGNTRRG